MRSGRFPPTLPRDSEGDALTRKLRPSQIAKVREHLTWEVLQAIERAPSSRRKLAREAGVSDVLLVQLRRGDFQATPAVAEKLAGALEKWGSECRDAARRIRAAARRVSTPRTKGVS
jgi:hypothetical protein